MTCLTVGNALFAGLTGDYLGGEAYWAGGLHLYTRLPFRPGRGGFRDLFRTHFFLNAGNLCNLNYGGSRHEELQGCVQRPTLNERIFT